MNTESLLAANGWTLECQSPLEIRNEDGSRATRQAALLVIADLREKSEAENGAPLNKAAGAYALLQAYLAWFEKVHATAKALDTTFAWDRAYDLVFSPNGLEQVKSIMKHMGLVVDKDFDDGQGAQECVERCMAVLGARLVSLEPFASVMTITCPIHRIGTK